MLEASRIICMGIFHLHINVLMQAFLSMLSKLEVFLLPAIFRRYMMIFLLFSAAKWHLLLSSAWHCCAPVSVTAGWLMACGGYNLKQAGDTEGKQRSGHQSCGNHRHHQQHILRDSVAWRPSLKAFPEVPPAASATGMRLLISINTSLMLMAFLALVSTKMAWMESA